MNPYQEIRKVPLDFNGVKSSAYAVQRLDEEKGWKEAGVVRENYLLVPNEEVTEAAEKIAQETDIKFEFDREFFNGHSFIYSMKSSDSIGEIKVGDDVALGLQFWNSYDGSRSFGFSMMLYRLLCTNGMMSKKVFDTYRFKHTPGQDEGWQESLDKVVTKINTISSGDEKIDNFILNLQKLEDYRITSKNLGQVRHNHLKDIPTSLWGQILDRFLDPAGQYHSETNGWGLLNSATDILWHKDKPNLAGYNQNAKIVDGLIEAVA
tara:strand:- start:156 stop:947 length:792 start_codon:yes stop_codon:yes gene_type:complete